MTIEECYRGYVIEILERDPEVWFVRLHACTWYYDLTSTFATKELALERAKRCIDRWKEEDNDK